jgi:hypothetical protein
LHLFFFSLLISSLILGGWELPRFIFVGLYSYFDLYLTTAYGSIGDYVYVLDELLINTSPYFGLIAYYYLDWVFDFLIRLYELYFLIIWNYLFYDFENLMFMYELYKYHFCAYYEDMKFIYDVCKYYFTWSV